MIKNGLQRIKIFILKKQADKQAKIRNEFLSEALEIVEKPVSPIGHVMIWIITLIIAFFAVWSICGRMDEVVSARGQVLTVIGTQNIQAVNVGVVEKICVREGEKVKKGDPVIMIDSSIDELTLKKMADELELLKLENELLGKVLEGKTIEEQYGDDNKNAEIVEYVLALQKEYLFQKTELENLVRQAELKIEMEQVVLEKIKLNSDTYAEQKETLNAIIDKSISAQSKVEALNTEIQYKEAELADYEELYAVGAISKAEVETLILEIDLLKEEYESASNQAFCEENNNLLQKAENEEKSIINEYDILAQENNILLAKQQYAQAAQNLETLRASFKTNLTGLIVENETQIKALETNLDIQEISVGQQTLTSPIDGVVKTLETNTVGGVVTTGQTVATIVPDDAKMIVEIDILNQDIGYIQVGQEVVMKLDTFNFQEYGKLEGEILTISPDAILDQSKGWIYKAKVEIDDSDFVSRNSGVEIGAGMECTAEVVIGERTIIEFFLEPIVEHFDGSLKVR